jgi:hypothetical protein
MTIVNNFNLPQRYLFIAPTTTSKIFHCINCDIPHSNECPLNGNTRNFTLHDWNNIIAFLDKNDIKGVVIGIEDITMYTKKSNKIIDLTNKTTIENAILILENSIGYIGIDTCFSVIASFCLKNIFIKCLNRHGVNYKDVYFYNIPNISLYQNMECLNTAQLV